MNDISFEYFELIADVHLKCRMNDTYWTSFAMHADKKNLEMLEISISDPSEKKEKVATYSDISRMAGIKITKKRK